MRSASDYYPFGWQMPGRKLNPQSYVYGFNGQLTDPEWMGGESVAFEFRTQDPRLGRFLSTDPLTAMTPWETPYAFAGNNPIAFIDYLGLSAAGPTDPPKQGQPILDDDGNQILDENNNPILASGDGLAEVVANQKIAVDPLILDGAIELRPSSTGSIRVTDIVYSEVPSNPTPTMDIGSNALPVLETGSFIGDLALGELFPAIDFANTGIELYNGNYFEATLHGIGIIPVVGGVFSKYAKSLSESISAFSKNFIQRNTNVGKVFKESRDNDAVFVTIYTWNARLKDKVPILDSKGFHSAIEIDGNVFDFQNVPGVSGYAQILENSVNLKNATFTSTFRVSRNTADLMLGYANQRVLGGEFRASFAGFITNNNCAAFCKNTLRAGGFRFLPTPTSTPLGLGIHTKFISIFSK